MSSSSGCNRSGSSARISSRSRTDGERGYALIAVVGIVGVLAVIAMALTERAQVGAAAAADFLEETRDLYAVQAGVAAAERTLAGKPDLDKEGQLRLTLTWDERQLEVLITDQAKKIDVNRAAAEQLAEGFAALGFSPDDAVALAAQAIDWRDSDDRLQPRGAEAEAYLAAGLLSRPRNERFVSLDEVGTLLGMPLDGSSRLHEQLAVMPAIVPIDPTPSRALSMEGLNRQTPAAAPSDGLTRSADVTPGTWDFDVEIRVRRYSETVERAYLSLLSE